MQAKHTFFLRLFGSLFALALLAAPSLGVALTITQVQVVVGGAVYCNTTVALCPNPIWTFPAGGVVLGSSQTLILTQNGTAIRQGEDFDTSDRGGLPDPLVACSTAGNTSCQVQISINSGGGLLPVSIDPSGNLNPLAAFNDEPFSDTGKDALFQEAAPWSLAPNFTGVGYALELGYADNIHGGVCDGDAGSCFPQQVWGAGNGAATVFIGNGVAAIGNCLPSVSFGPPNFHTPTDGAGNTVGCYDGGALKITAPAANIDTITQGGWHAPPHGHNPGTILNAYYTAHPGHVFTIGGTGSCVSPKSATFNSADAIRAFLPAGKTPGSFTQNYTNPTTPPGTSAGVFAGQVLALTLNTQVLSSGGDLLAYVITAGPATGKTVAQVLADANIALGCGTLPSYVTSISELNDVVNSINNLFD